MHDKRCIQCPFFKLLMFAWGGLEFGPSFKWTTYIFFLKYLKISLFQSKILFLGRAIFPQNWVQTQPNPSTIFGPMGFDSDGSKKIKRCSCNFHRNQDKKILLCTENELTSFGFGLFLALNMSFKELNAVSWNSIVF